MNDKNTEVSINESRRNLSVAPFRRVLFVLDLAISPNPGDHSITAYTKPNMALSLKSSPILFPNVISFSFFMSAPGKESNLP